VEDREHGSGDSAEGALLLRRAFSSPDGEGTTREAEGIDPNLTLAQPFDWPELDHAPSESSSGNPSRLSQASSTASRATPLEAVVTVTPLSAVPGAFVEKYLGRISIHVIKEVWNIREMGGMGTFVHRFLAEANSLARAHVVARGGNALLGYTLHELATTIDKRNQAYSVISLSGDAALIRPASSTDP
jgi:hypothetical protein